MSQGRLWVKGLRVEEIVPFDSYKSNSCQPLTKNSTTNDILLRLKSFGESFDPSEEQLSIIKASLSGNDIKVQAFAGTGKTTTIRLITQCLCKRSLYIAFNSAIVNQAQNLHQTVSKTAHSIAFNETVARSPQYKKKFEKNAKTWANKSLR